jgi:hypothetical protein
MAGKPSKKEQEKFTAVVYFHGMGNQKRFEEASRLVDALDRYDYKMFSTAKKLVGIEARLERPLSNIPRDVGFIELLHRQTLDKSQVRRKYRFYEAYWANLTAGGVPVNEVVEWLFKQTLAPLKALVSPWREMARLRRSILVENWPRLVEKRSDLTKNDQKRLVRFYEKFEGWEARRKFPKGSGRQFTRFLIENNREHPQQTERLTWAANQWWRIYAKTNLINLLLLFTLLLAIFLILYVLFLLSAAALQATTRIISPGLLDLIGEEKLLPTPRNITILITTILSALGLSNFLKEYMGDVYFWCTYEETAKKHQTRRAILDCSTESLKHVLLNDDCERIVVVAHSLGTTIAYDTILELARTNRARGLSPKDKFPLEKIQHFITLASPIDKVHYFFENQTSKYHRYNRVVEQIRGDIATFPFSKSGGPLIHWINFWDKADIISGSLQTPASASYTSLKVDNREVGSFLFPFPGGAHLAYFENNDVIEIIYQSTFENKFNFPEMRKEKGKRVKYSNAFIGPGKGLITTRPFQLLVMVLPWLAAFQIITGLLGAGQFLLNPLIAGIGIIILGMIIGWRWGHLKKL